LLLTRYNEDKPEVELKEVTVAVPHGYKVSSVRLTDSQKEMDRKLHAGGESFNVTLEPHAVMLIEFLPLQFM
jgi:hypothetical protein